MSHKWEAQFIRPVIITDHTKDELHVDPLDRLCGSEPEEQCVVRIWQPGGPSIHLTDDDRQALIVALGGTVAP